MTRFNLISLLLFIFQSLSATDVANPDFFTHTPFIYQSVNVITGEYVESDIDLALNGPKTINIRRSYGGNNSKKPGWHFNHPNILTPDSSIPSPKHVQYAFDEQERLIEAKVTVEKGDKWYHHLNFTYHEGEDVKCQVETQDARFVHYTFSKLPTTRYENPYLLEKVKTFEGREISYTYCDHPLERRKLITRREETPGNYLITKYYNSSANNVGGTIVTIPSPSRDFRMGRVKLQQAPVGPDSSPIITGRFFYYLGNTVVFDAYDHKTIYRYDEHSKLTAIEYFLEEDTIYRKHCFFWDEYQRLTSKTVQDGEGRTYYCQTFKYDDFGNIAEEAMYGNLTGKSSVPFSLDEKGNPKKKHLEVSRKSFRYNDQGHLVLEKREDETAIQYEYSDDTDLLTAKYCYNSEGILFRHFYEYDSSGHLIEMIFDDGKTQERNSLEGVTERRITVTTPRQDLPALGFPQEIAEYYYDFSTEQLKLLQTTHFCYSDRGELIQKETYDCEDILVSHQEMDYDEMGHLVYKSNKKSETETYTYDRYGNLIYATSPKGAISYSYDAMNRIVESLEEPKKGPHQHHAYTYDYTNHKTSSIDTFGNKTQYLYDPLERLVQTIHPEVTTLEGGMTSPVLSQSYDLFDRIQSITNGKGETTYTTYNIRGKPIKIVHSDKTEELFEYNEAGSLLWTQSPTGQTIVYKRDALSRVVEESHFDQANRLLKKIEREYTSFRLLEEKDNQGNCKKIRYDGMGRPIEIIEESSEGVKYTVITYDSQGKVIGRQEWYGTQKEKSTLQELEWEDNRLISSSFLTSEGELLKKSTAPAESENEPEIQYDYNYRDARGDRCLRQLVRDKDGITTISTFDALGRVCALQKKDSFGNLLTKKEITYDLAGNKCQEIFYDVGSGRNGQYICRWNYGPHARLEEMIEGFGTSLEKSTTYKYYEDGQLQSITKPDGISIHYRYTPHGKIRRCYSSDKTINLQYFYEGDQLISVYDYTREEMLQRYYDQGGRLEQEDLPNGLKLKYRYDERGRRTKILLPDNSEICYKYDALYLREIKRNQADGSSYSTQYTSYSLEGQLLETQLPMNLGTLNYQYDSEGRTTKIQSTFWEESLQYNESAQVSEIDFRDPSGKYHSRFDYDPLSHLTEESGLSSHNFAYDAISNRIELDDAAISIDALNQMTQDKKAIYAYDRNGNLIQQISPHQTIDYKYDAFNRLLKIIINQKEKWSYTYDAFNRRLSETHYTWGEATQSWKKLEKRRFLYENNREIGSCDEKGNIVELRSLGIGLCGELGATTAIEIEGKPYVPIHDHRGSISCLIDPERKAPVSWYRYTAFGECESFSNFEDGVYSPWTFCSKRAHDASGLIFFGQRYYSPQMGRWITQDPLGTPEGINNYVYVQNNPMGFVDPYGLFSVSSFWHSLYGAVKRGFDCVHTTIHNLKNQYSFMEEAGPAINFILENIFGTNTLAMAGYYSGPSEQGVLGNGEINEKVRVTLINGILNARIDFKQTLEFMSEVHGGTNIHYFFDATSGWTGDMFKSFLARLGFVSPQAKELAQTWQNLIEEMGGIDGGGKIIHYAHSIGATHTKTALSLLSPEERAMIQVYTFGSPTMIYGEGTQNVLNFMSVRDGVSLLDPYGFICGVLGVYDEIVPIGTWLGIPLIDHTFNGGSYIEVMEILGRHFLQIYLVD